MREQTSFFDKKKSLNKGKSNQKKIRKILLVDLPVLMERPTMVIVAPHLGDLPRLDGFNIFLCTCQNNGSEHRKRQKDSLLHCQFLLVFKLQRYSYFDNCANFFSNWQKSSIFAT